MPWMMRMRGPMPSGNRPFDESGSGWMDAANVASWATAVAMGLLGLAGGRLWARLRSSAARRHRAGKLTALRAELEQHKLRASALEAQMHAQRAHSFALERELEARESDWAQSSPTPFSFDAQTFQIDRSTTADLERQARELDDQRSKLPRPRPTGMRSAQASRKLPERRHTAAPAWVELDAANSAHGTPHTSLDQDRQPPKKPSTRNRRRADASPAGRESKGAAGMPGGATAGEIEGLARHVEAIRNSPPPADGAEPVEPKAPDPAQGTRTASQ